jgi:hypothetical protein
MFSGGCLISTSSYEQYTYASRLLGGPFVPLIYQVQDPLYLSRRGLWSNQDEMTLAGDPDAPGAVAGFVAQPPKESNGYYLGIQTTL